MTRATSTEIIAIASGKGGTGKTLLAASLGYSLVRGGHRVLMIDADPGTDGLSLFLLGPKGSRHIDAFRPENTFTGVLREFHQTGSIHYEPQPVHRTASGDHGVSYEALISGKGIYGDETDIGNRLAVPDLDRGSFRRAIAALFQQLRSEGEYDYVIVDTRGGFAFESTDICALADGFLVVTEPDFTSFYQDRNLVRRISTAATELQSRPLLRAIVVNKATENRPGAGSFDLAAMEHSFRLELTREFPVRFEDTHPIPVDIEVIKAYKTQQIPYVAAPASPYSFASLSAFGEILRVVTSSWSPDRVEKWNRLVDTVSHAIRERSEAAAKEQKREAERAAEAEALARANRELKIQLEQVTQELALSEKRYQERIEHLRSDFERAEKRYEREIERTQLLFKKPPQSPAAVAELESPDPVRPAPGSSAETASILVRPSSRRNWYWLAAVAAVSIVLAAVWMVMRTQSAQDLAERLYSVDTPPAERVYHLNRAYRSGRRNFESINFYGLDLARISLDGVSLRFAQLTGARIQGGSLAKADLTGATMISSELQNANLSEANLTKANLIGANLDGTDLRGAILLETQVTREQLARAKTDERTILPDGSQGPAPKATRSTPGSSAAPRTPPARVREAAPHQMPPKERDIAPEDVRQMPAGKLPESTDPKKTDPESPAGKPYQSK